MEGIVLNDEQRETVITQYTSTVVLDAYEDRVVLRCILNGSNDYPDIPEGAERVTGGVVKRITFGVVANTQVEWTIDQLRLSATPSEDES